MLREAAQGLTGSFLQRELPGEWLCFCPDFYAGELKIFRVMGNLLWKKIAVICIFGQGANRTEFGLMMAKPSLSISVEGTEGLQKMPCSERQDHYWVSLLINQIKGKEGA